MPDPDSCSLTVLLIILFTLLARTYAVYSKTLLDEFSEIRMKRLCDEGSEKAGKILKISNDSEKYTRSITAFLMFTDFVMVCSAQAGITTELQKVFEELGLGETLSYIISSVCVLGVLLFIAAVFGYLLPLKCAERNTDSKILKHYTVIRIFCAVFKPFAYISDAAASFLFGLTAGEPRETELSDETEEEILMMVDEGEEKGVIEEAAKDMIENIFDFHDTTADEIMTHRTDVVAIEDTKSIEDAAALSIKFGCSRIPVFHEDIDDILGVVYVKDLLKYIGHEVDKSLKLTDVMRKAYFIPESKRCGELFTEMTEKRIQIAIIVDEYGGTEGIITMEDLLESIVGNIQDEYDNEEEEIKKISDNVFTVEGTAPIDEIADMLDTQFPEGEYDTVAGFVVELLGRIPSENEHPSAKFNEFIFIVEKIEDRRISRIKIIRKEMKKTEQKEEKLSENRE